MVVPNSLILRLCRACFDTFKGFGACCRNKEQNAFGGQQNDSGAPGCEKEGMVPKAVVILLPCSLGREGDARYSYVGQHPSLHIGRCACGNVYIFVLEFFSCT